MDAEKPVGDLGYQIRIVGYAMADPEQLLAHPDNYRVHPKNQQESLDGILSEVGFVQNIIVNEVTGRVIDGHLRVALALRKNIKSIPITIVNLTEAEEALVLATFDPITAMAKIDNEKLEELLRYVETDNTALQELLYSSGVEEGITDVLNEPNVVLPDEENAYILIVDVSTIDEYYSLHNELQKRGYKVKGNQK
jgi:hypothetical protein